MKINGGSLHVGVDHKQRQPFLVILIIMATPQAKPEENHPLPTSWSCLQCAQSQKADVHFPSDLPLFSSDRICSVTYLVFRLRCI
jgi:hypothetical protein